MTKKYTQLIIFRAIPAFTEGKPPRTLTFHYDSPARAWADYSEWKANELADITVVGIILYAKIEETGMAFVEEAELKALAGSDLLAQADAIRNKIEELQK